MILAPMVGNLTENACEVTWQSCKPVSGDTIEYRLQLATDGNYKQVGVCISAGVRAHHYQVASKQESTA